MFDRLIGNQRAKETLRRMLAGRRVPGALLFAGEDGVGKKLFAIELAKALNCRRGGTEACDDCPACARIGRLATATGERPSSGSSSDGENTEPEIIWGEHADVGLVRASGRSILVKQVRAVERESNFRPFEGRARLFLIEDADKLNEASSNSLLKTLEEIPQTSHVILITSRPASLLPTIRSRCQSVRFTPLGAAEIEAHLSGGGKKLSAGDARLVARLARGSLGRAATMDVESYRAQRDLMLEVVEALALTGDRSRLLRVAEDLSDAKHKEDYEPRLEALEALIHDVWRLSLQGAGAELVNEDIGERLKRITARTESRRAARWLARIEELRGQLAVNINRRVATDALFVAMAAGDRDG